MGVCSQFDVLFDELTAYEHLQLFAELKGVKKLAIKPMIAEILHDVELFHVRKHQELKIMDQFSGEGSQSKNFQWRNEKEIECWNCKYWQPQNNVL